MSSRAVIVDGEVVELFSKDEAGRLHEQAKSIMKREAEYEYVHQLEQEIILLREQLEFLLGGRDEDEGGIIVKPKPLPRKKAQVMKKKGGK